MVIDETLVRALLREQHPDLADRELRPTEGGWNNRMWRLGDDLAIRLPRTERAPAQLAKEHQWIPVLAPRLPVPVPVPVHLGEPSARFPSAWIVTTWVAGESADDVPIERIDAAEVLGRFLDALHREAPQDAPRSPNWEVPLSAFDDNIEQRFRAFDEQEDVDQMRAIWEDATAADGWDRPSVWLHGDLHPANVVVAEGTLAGVIDFGELRAGDPAADLMAAWLLLPQGAAERCFEAYGAADDATLRRARGWALLKSLVLIEAGRTGGRPKWRPAGEAALARLLT
jgi:aminoglycoside phosphotransferase (APT) family kinase protein